MQFRTAEVAAACDGELRGDASTIVENVTIDSHAVVAGSLFVPIVAERDGHDFVAAAVDAGARAHLTSRPEIDVAPSSVLVRDTGAGLLALGRAARRRLDVPVVGITGSVGKTTTKDHLVSILNRIMRVTWTPGNFNNELGVPLTLANADPSTEVAVIEMGARGVGHIRQLCEVASPTIGVVTRIAAAHTSEFGTIDEIARAKGELVEALPRSGVAVLNGDDVRVAALATRTDARVVLVGKRGDVTASSVRLGDDLHAEVRLELAGETLTLRLGAPGPQQVPNALLAAAVASELGAASDDIVAGLTDSTMSRWRMEVATTREGATVINDAYNSSPTALLAALDALAAHPAPNKIAVLGVMAELGDRGPAAHLDAGRHAAAHGIEVIEIDADYGAPRAASSTSQALELIGRPGADTAILVKGSRIAGLERVARALLDPS